MWIKPALRLQYTTILLLNLSSALGESDVCDEDIFITQETEPYCVQRVGHKCQEDPDCQSHLAVCHGGRCQCDTNLAVEDKDGLFAECKGFLGSSCIIHSDCDKGKVKHAVCDPISWTCKCADRFQEINSTCVSSGSSSAGHDTAGALRADDVKEPSGATRYAIIVAGSVFGAVMVVGLLVGVSQRRSPLPSRNARRFFSRLMKSDQSEGEAQSRLRNSKAKSSPNEKRSLPSLASYKSAGKKKREGPDFGESSTDELAKYIHRKVMRKARQEQDNPKSHPRRSKPKQFLPQTVIDTVKKDKDGGA